MEASSRARVMIVDDSETMRGLLRSELGGDPRIEVVAHARNGRVALPRVRYYKPDVVLLDVEMPEMDGLETLEAIRRETPDVKVIMFSARTERSARHTIRALGMGAVDFVLKPVFERDGDPRTFIRDVIRSRIHSLTKQTTGIAAATPLEQALPPSLAPAGRIPIPDQIRVCGIGISTGGPVALRKLLSSFPAKFRGSLVIVQHMPPVFTQMLADSLNSETPCRVLEGQDGMQLEESTVYLAPGGRQMEVGLEGGSPVLRIFEGEPELNCRPSVNVLFRSLAAVFGSKALGVIMTGMGNDGCEGMKAMRAEGSYLLAQDRESCVIYGMPDAVTKIGIVDEVRDVDGLSRRIVELLGGLR